MITRGIIRKSTYRDSVTLMKISNTVASLRGISQAAVVMATDLNMKLLEDTGLLTSQIKNATVSDLVIAVSGETEEAIDSALIEVDNLLSAPTSDIFTDFLPKTLDSALSLMPESNLVLISVPGQFAKREAMKALKKGLNVFLFSSNVPIDEELQLKQFARKHSLLMMGPDCGTSIINNVVLGFGNVIRQGSIGIVSASGTGLQEVSALIHKEGLGISQAIGTGGRDLSQAIGGIMMVEGIKLLTKDEKTQAIVLISKLPNPSICRRILKVASKTKKPVVINFLGSQAEKVKPNSPVTTLTLEEAAKAACALIRGGELSRIIFDASKRQILSVVISAIAKMSEKQKYLRGLFSGGTLCAEAQLVLYPLIGNIHSNVPLAAEYKLDDANKSIQNCCIDMGSEDFVVGRPHPMIDFTLRKQRIIKEASDPETAVILLDIVLGYGSNPDPASELVPTIEEAKAIAEKDGRRVCFVTSVLGTTEDPQNLHKQERKLKRADVVIMPSNAQAARIAALITTRNKVAKEIFGEELKL